MSDRETLNRPPRQEGRSPVGVVGTLALGAVGGWAAYEFRLPLAWMIGAMVAVTVGALAGLPLTMSRRLRAVMVAILGIMLGSAFTPEVAARMGQWLASLAALTVYIAGLTALVLLYLRRVARYDPITAFFAATPGGLNEMVMVGGALGGDDRVISLVHGARILLIVLTVPVWFRLMEGYVPGARIGFGGGLGAIAAGDLAVLALSGLAGAWLAHRLKVPAANLSGPMVLSALAHLTGMTASRPPAELIALAQVVVGCAVGSRFAGVPLGQVLHTLLIAVGSTAIMLAATVGASLVLAPLTGAPVSALVLALAPGGLAEMSLIALSLDVDAAFVSTHHIARIIIVVVLAPIVFAFVLRRRKAGDRSS